MLAFKVSCGTESLRGVLTSVHGTYTFTSATAANSKLEFERSGNGEVHPIIYLALNGHGAMPEPALRTPAPRACRMIVARAHPRPPP